MQRYLLNVCKWQNLFSDCINRNSLESTHLLCYYFIDIDECLDPSTHSCDSNANCTNTNGSYQCKCNQGYHGNGNTCTGIYVINFRHSSCFFGVIHSRNMNKVENREQTFKTRFPSLSCLLLQTLTNALRDPIHVMEMQTVPTLMVHSNVNVKLAFQGTVKHAEVFIKRLQIAKFIFRLH